MIVATNVNTGERLLYDNAVEASTHLSIDASNIRKVLNGKRKSANGYTFSKESVESDKTCYELVREFITNIGFDSALKMSPSGFVLRFIDLYGDDVNFDTLIRYRRKLTRDFRIQRDFGNNRIQRNCGDSK